jgi:hypothetical protein
MITVAFGPYLTADMVPCIGGFGITGQYDPEVEGQMVLKLENPDGYRIFQCAALVTWLEPSSGHVGDVSLWSSTGSHQNDVLEGVLFTGTLSDFTIEVRANEQCTPSGVPDE